MKLHHWIYATCIAMALLVVSMFYRAGRAHALPDVRAQLATALSQVALHEGALESPRDTLLIWQCAETNATTPAGQLAWLRRHSPRATGMVPALANDANAWTANFDFLTVPTGFTEARYFRSVTMPRAQAVYRLAQGLVRGDPYDKPCKGVAPRTWDGRRYGTANAARRGLYPVGCLQTANEGFAPASAFRGAG